MNTPELLAPAGQPDAAYAALHYGADAVYLGLKNFSARAEADNFSPEELQCITNYAHSLTPKRKIYLAVNTLIKEDELAAAAETLLIAAEIGVDAVIIQDLGIAKLARERFPGLHLHASTQMAIHSLAGVHTAQRLGFSRVTLARELTLDEIQYITRNTNLEIETFIHGTLCYSYSGLCLFSSIASGRSGNRGRCVYSCREAADTPAGTVHPFSLKDYALGTGILDLAAAHVASLKIEGRKKSPLYVAATVDYYRRILDGKIQPDEIAAAEAKLQTIFARPWTRFFIDGRHNPAAADTGVVGHRGARIGVVEKVVPTPAGPGLVFHPSRAVERHDGLQVDIPGETRPYGLPVDNLYQMDNKGRLKSTFAAVANTAIAVTLPPDAPTLTRGLPLYQSSSQEVKRSFPFPTPSAGKEKAALTTDVSIVITSDNEPGFARVAIETRTALPDMFIQLNPAPLAAQVRTRLPAFPARDAAGAATAARSAFARMGGSRFRLGEMALANPDSLYLKPGDWNTLRRQCLEDLETLYQERREKVVRLIATLATAPASPSSRTNRDFSWSLCVDNIEDLAEFTDADLDLADEIQIGMPLSDEALHAFEMFSSRSASRTVRLIIPLILRRKEWDALLPRVHGLLKAGQRRWLVGNPGGLDFFEQTDRVDLAADWTLYAGNSLAARQLFELGFTSFTLSPEDNAATLRALLDAYNEAAQIVAYSDLPLFISAACAHTHLGLCAGPKATGKCPYSTQGLRIGMEKSGKVEIYAQSCGSIVVAATPFSLLERLDSLKSMGAHKLCIDLRWRPRPPTATRTLWHSIRNGHFPGGVTGNFSRSHA